jgi:hypothetical protein
MWRVGVLGATMQPSKRLVKKFLHVEPTNTSSLFQEVVVIQQTSLCLTMQWKRMKLWVRVERVVGAVKIAPLRVLRKHWEWLLFVLDVLARTLVVLLLSVGLRVLMEILRHVVSVERSTVCLL